MSKEKKLDTGRLEEFIAQYPIYEYRILDTATIAVEERVRMICKEECERYGSTWACPPAVGSLSECEARIRSYPEAILFTSVAEVTDFLNMKELLSTRMAHENITNALGRFLREEGFEIFILSTESCEICENCTWPQGKPCRHPEHMHPCLESHGVVVQELAEREGMEYNLGGGTVLWFSMILCR
ncbi:MAG: DUF2284 domain-containing protein [Clostridiales bacterium]|nr:DUF2284 domain-containing protein [Clostridiales bacterium]